MILVRGTINELINTSSRCSNLKVCYMKFLYKIKILSVKGTLNEFILQDQNTLQLKVRLMKLK